MDDYSRMMETEREIAREEAEWQTLKIEEMRVFSEQTFGVDFHDQLRKTARNTTFFSLFKRNGESSFQEVHNFQYRSMQQFFGQMPLLKAEVDRWQNKTKRSLFCSYEERIQKSKSYFRTLTYVVSNWDQLLDGHVQLSKGHYKRNSQEVHNFQYRSMQQFFGQMPLLKAEVDRWQNKTKRSLFCSYERTDSKSRRAISGL